MILEVDHRLITQAIEMGIRDGISLNASPNRDTLAAMAMQGIASMKTMDLDVDVIAHSSYAIADAMIVERESNKDRVKDDF